MKKEYIIPEINVSGFITENILTTSTITAVGKITKEKMNGIAPNNMHVSAWNSMS